MIIISDTSLLSSFAAGNGIDLLFRLFSRSTIGIPPVVFQELQRALERDKVYLEPILDAIVVKRIEVISLSAAEDHVARNLPRKLNPGECQAIALAQSRNTDLLCNDKRAIRYCQEKEHSRFRLT